MNKLDVSIIITTRNRYSDLLACITSVLASDFNNLHCELIIVDDFSTDETKNITSNTFSHPDISFNVIHLDSQHMMVRTRNIGAKTASGEFVLFIDDDNELDPNMIKNLHASFAKDAKLGVVGPSMWYFNTQKKYMDYQTIHFFTGKTFGMLDTTDTQLCLSTGVPNVFMIRKEVFDKCGYFDESLVQTFTEPDFSLNILRSGYKSAIYKPAITYHKVDIQDTYTAKFLGGKFKQKAYCLMRNRTVVVCRYGSTLQKLIYLTLFSWFWPLVYSTLMLREKRFDLIRLYWQGWYDGISYFFTRKLNNTFVYSLGKS